MRLYEYWKEISECNTSDEMMIKIKEMMHKLFDAEYVIVFSSPPLPPQKEAAPADMRVEFVPTRENVEAPPPVHKQIEPEEHRYIPPEQISREVLNEFVRLGGMEIEGHDEIILNFVAGGRYIGFISLHRKKKFTRIEKRRISMLKPYLLIAMRLIGCMSLKEEMPNYAFEYLINNLVVKYNLTPAEEFVLKGLVKGLDLREIALERKTSIHAIRKIVRSIYKKVGIQRRAELLTKVFQII